MNSRDELAQLKKEVAELKQTVNALSRFLSLEESETTPGKMILTIQCSTILLSDTDGRLQGIICARDKSSEIALWGSDQKCRVHLEATDEGSITVYQPEQKKAVEIAVHEKTGPYLAVFDADQPRAIMKATENGGAVAVCHDDGHPRAMMLSESQAGEFCTVDADMHIATKMSSGGIDGGGLLTINHPNGKAAVIIDSTPKHGLVLVNDGMGKPFVSLPSAKDL